MPTMFQPRQFVGSDLADSRAVVGDTFPLGCPFSDKIVYSEFFDLNPDLERAEFQRPFGRYSEGCGLDSVVMSWGHDE